MANDDNSCRLEVNSTVDCVLLTDLRTTSGEDVVPIGQIRGTSDNVYLYWMAGATGCGVVWAIVNTLTLIALSEFIRALYKVEEKKHTKKIAVR